VRFLTNLRLWQKLVVVAATLILPLTIATWLLMAKVRDDLAFTASELDGVATLQAVEESTAALAEYRAAQAASAGGNAEWTAKLPSLLTAADTQFAGMAEALGGRPATASLKPDAERAVAAWHTAKSAPADRQADALGGVARELLALNSKLLDRSQLAFDPIPASYYLVIAGGQELPAYEVNVGESASTAVHALAARSDPRRIAAAATEHAELATVFERIETSIQGAVDYDPAMAQKVGPALNATRAAVNDYLGLIDASVLHQTRSDVTAAQLIAASATALEKVGELHDVIVPELQRVLDERHAAQVRNGWTMGIGVAVLLALAMLLVGYVTRTITKPIGRAVEVCGAIAAGKYDNAIAADTTEESGQLLKSLGTMQEQLRAQIESERRVAAEMARIKQALDASSSAVTVADAAGTIIYQNRAGERLFRDVESDFRKALPRFSADGVVGAKLDGFYADASGQQTLLSRLDTSHRSEFVLGGRTVAVNANPITSDDRERIGTVVEWVDRTADVAIERELEQVIGEAAAGQLGRRVNLAGKHGFHHTVGEQANKLLGVTEGAVQDLQRVFTALSEGRLTERVTADYDGAYAKLKVAANATVDKLSSTVQQIQLTADLVSSGAQELSRGNENLSQRTEEQASSLEETASSMEEMTSTVKHNADNAAQANQLAAAARGFAQKGGDVVGRAVSAMGEINQSSRRIAEIIGVIDEIAFQTNLLALNAAVEAARAGEQGRGFAVVATEVRNLASRSAEAAKQIKALIEDSVRKVDDGSKLVDESGRTLDDIVGAVKKVTDLIAEITAASREQATGVEEVNKAVMQMDEMTQQNAALVEEAAAATEALTEQAQSLAQLVSFFDLGAATAQRTRASATAIRASAPRGLHEVGTTVKSQAARQAARATAPVAARESAPADDVEWEKF
jgi:methyl-accepting chemotaxis protein